MIHYSLFLVKCMLVLMVITCTYVQAIKFSIINSNYQKKNITKIIIKIIFFFNSCNKDINYDLNIIKQIIFIIEHACKIKHNLFQTTY
jgi:hypothetical protein